MSTPGSRRDASRSGAAAGQSPPSHRGRTPFGVGLSLVPIPRASRKIGTPSLSIVADFRDEEMIAHRCPGADPIGCGRGPGVSPLWGMQRAQARRYSLCIVAIAQRAARVAQFAAASEPMEIGIIGLGRMGGNMALCLIAKGHRVVVNNRSTGLIKEIASHGAIAANTPGRSPSWPRGRRSSLSSSGWATWARSLSPSQPAPRRGCGSPPWCVGLAALALVSSRRTPVADEQHRVGSSV